MKTAERAEPAKGREGLVGKWSGWGMPMSGKGTIKVEGGKYLTEGHLDGPVGVAAAKQ